MPAFYAFTAQELRERDAERLNPLLARIAELELREKRLRRLVANQRARADLWRHRCLNP